MNPQNPYTIISIPQQPPQDRAKTKRVALAAIALFLVVAVIAGLFVFQAMRFRIASTDPSLGSVAYYAPQLQITFNKPLSSKDLSVFSMPAVISKKSVSGKTLTLTFQSALTKNKAYTVTINSITDSGGAQLKNQVLTFTAKDIPYDKISKSQQKAVVAAQDQYPYSANSINYVGNATDDIISAGVTLSQLNGMKQAFFKFGQSPHAQIQQITIDPDSITAIPLPPNSTSTTNTMTFNVTIDKIPYSARLDYSLLTTSELYLYDSTGAQVFDSGTIDASPQ